MREQLVHQRNSAKLPKSTQQIILDKQVRGMHLLRSWKRTVLVASPDVKKSVARCLPDICGAFSRPMSESGAEARLMSLALRAPDARAASAVSGILLTFLFLFYFVLCGLCLWFGSQPNQSSRRRIHAQHTDVCVCVCLSVSPHQHSHSQLPR